MKRKTVLFTFFLFINVFVFKALSENARTQIVQSTGTVTVASYTDKEVLLSGNAELHLTAASALLNNSIVRLNSENAWLYFDNIRPAAVLSGILPYLYVNDAPAVNKTNVRVAIYKQGTVVMAQPSTYQPLTVFTDINCTGDSAKYGLFTKYASTGLGTGIDNKIQSFRLKKGYMATLATSGDGTGYSRVYIADNADLIVNSLPFELDQMISFVRVFNWEYTSKKGWCGTGAGCITDAEKVNGTWSYSWSADQNSSAGVEYVPIRQNGGWPGWSEISGKQYVSHVLGFNEPDHTEQSNLTVSQALAQWPDMMRTGLRIGSPAVTNNSWIYSFMDSCKAKNYRVDFVAYHAYWGGKSPANWYNDLKAIHDRTGRPLWITEWNNGANWTTEWWPTSDRSLSALNAAKQLADLKGILTVLDTAHFIERYSIYNWVENCRAMILADTLTPAGKYYKSNSPDLAFRRVNEVIPTFSLGKTTISISTSGKVAAIVISDPNGEFYRGFILEKKVGNGDWTPYIESNIATQKYVSDTIDLSKTGTTRYRLRTKLPNGTLSGSYTNEVGVDVTQGTTVQVGTVGISNIGWNPVLLNQPFTSVPTIITSGASNRNSGTLVTTRARLINFSTNFNIQVVPWAYQNISSLAVADTVNYLACNSGDYEFGGIKAYAGKASIANAWATVTFPTPFDTIPVVLTTQLLSPTAYATTVRIRNVSKTGFQARIMKETTNTSTLATETISYLALTPGSGVIDNHKARVGFTATNGIVVLGVSGSVSSVQYGDSLGHPLFIGQMQTCNDDTTAVLRTIWVGPKYANVVKQREKSSGQTYMKSETAGFLAIDLNSNVSTSLPKNTTEAFRIYPNPTTDILHFGTSYPQGIDVSIFDLTGQLLSNIRVFGDQLNVRDLPKGCYLLKSNTFGTVKFIKQ
jgi:hypothetical protein